MVTQRQHFGELYDLIWNEDISPNEAWDRANEIFAPQWRPIKTAPKDGTWILIWGDPYTDHPVVASWGHYPFKPPEVRTWTDETEIYSPTHWMPLLEPPNVRDDR